MVGDNDKETVHPGNWTLVELKLVKIVQHTGDGKQEERHLTCFSYVKWCFFSQTSQYKKQGRLQMISCLRMFNIPWIL